MGQGLSFYDSPTTDLKPGTYRIKNIASKTVIEPPDKDRRKVLGWAPSVGYDDKHQLWYVQRAGRGYQFKNCHFGTYFGAPSTSSGTHLCASEYPMTWVVHPIQGQDTYILQMPGNDRVLELSDTGKENNTIHLQPIGDAPDCRRWKFEYVNAESDSVDIRGLERKLQSQEEEIKMLRHLVLEMQGTTERPLVGEKQRPNGKT